MSVPTLTRTGRTYPISWSELETWFGQVATAINSVLGLGARSSVAYTTAPLAAGGVDSTATLTVPKAYTILKVATDYPARVRVYLTAAHQLADVARAVTVDPTGDHGCVLEAVTTAGVLALNLSPAPVGASPTDGTTAYLTVTNLDTVTRAITTTLSLLPMEP